MAQNAAEQEIEARRVRRDLRLVAQIPVVDDVHGQDGDLDGVGRPVEVHVQHVPHLRKHQFAGERRRAHRDARSVERGFC
jgi:hypothetical protein